MSEIYTVADGNRVFGADIDQVATWLNNFYLNVKGPAWGAKGDGVTDDWGVIQGAINAAQSAGGGTVLLPPTANSYIISNSLTISADIVKLVGLGRASVIQTKSSFPASAPMVWYQGPGGAGNFRFGAGMSDLRLVNTAGPTSAIGIQLDSTYYARIHRVDIEGIYANNVYLNGISGAFGAYTSIRDCHLGNVPSGAASGGIGILTNNHEFNVIDSCVLNWFKNTGGYGIKLQNGSNVIKGCTFDENDTGIWVWFQQHNKIAHNQFDRGVTQFVYLNGCKDTTIDSNAFQGFVGTGSKSIITVDGGSSNASNSVVNNTCKASSGWTNFVNELSTGFAVPNTYANNDTAGLGIVRQASTGGIFRDNRGYNPVGSVTPPAVPASGTAQSNNTGYDCMVLVTGGTVSNIAIGGINTGQTSGWFRVPALQTITLTYTVAPSWSWYGE